MRHLPESVEQALASNHGLLTVDVAAGAGISRRSLQRYCARGLLLRVARGAYASCEALESATPWEAFALKSRGFVVSAGPNAYAAGWSAVAIAGFPTISPPPPHPQIVVPRELGHATNSTFGEVWRTPLPPEQRTLFRGTRMVSAARAVVDIARSAPRADALVVADAALALGTTREDLLAVAGFQARWRNIAKARWALEHADPYAETALESLGRLACIEYRLPIPISNAWIELGPLRYRPDHLLDEFWLILEGDGSQKYDDRPDAGSIVARQREREWHFREAGFEIGRYGGTLHDTTVASCRSVSVH